MLREKEDTTHICTSRYIYSKHTHILHTHIAHTHARYQTLASPRMCRGGRAELGHTCAYGYTHCTDLHIHISIYEVIVKHPYVRENNQLTVDALRAVGLTSGCRLVCGLLGLCACHRQLLLELHGQFVRAVHGVQRCAGACPLERCRSLDIVKK